MISSSIFIGSLDTEKFMIRLDFIESIRTLWNEIVYVYTFSNLIFILFLSKIGVNGKKCPSPDVSATQPHTATRFVYISFNHNFRTEWRSLRWICYFYLFATQEICKTSLCRPLIESDLVSRYYILLKFICSSCYAFLLSDSLFRVQFRAHHLIFAKCTVTNLWLSVDIPIFSHIPGFERKLNLSCFNLCDKYS